MFTAAILSSFRLPPLENAAWQARKAIVIVRTPKSDSDNYDCTLKLNI